MKRLFFIILIASISITSSWAGGRGYGGVGVHYGHGYGGHYYGGSYYGGDAALALITGMIFGGLIAHYSNSRQQQSYPPQTTVAPRQSAPLTVQPQRIVHRKSSGCVMTREYTTTIKLDGKERQAYGTRCMKPDGSWVLGSPKLVPEFK